MKKLMSIFLSIVIIISNISVGFFVFAKEIDDIENFIDEATEIISEYDSDKEYTVSSSSLDFQTCRLIVEQSQNFNPLNSVAVADGFENFHIVQFENEEDTKSAYDFYSSSEDVISVDADGIAELCDYDTDNSNFDTYDVNNMIYKQSNSMKISSAKQYILDYCPNYNDEIVIGIVDSGVMREHPALQGRFIGGKSFVGGAEDGGDDIVGHGTMVAGVIVDCTLPNTKFRSYQIAKEKSISTSNIVLGILQAIEDEVDVINISISGQEKSSVMQSAINSAFEKNIKVVAGSGNDGVELVGSNLRYPACYDNVITAGATAFTLSGRSSYSNYGKAVDIYSVGEVYTTSNDGCYTSTQGTSFSAPYVSGVCAMLSLLYPDDNVNQTKLKIHKGSIHASSGFYMLNFYDTITIPEVYEEYTNTPTITVTDCENTNEKLVTITCDDNEKYTKIYYYTETLSPYVSGYKDYNFFEFKDIQNYYTQHKYSEPFVVSNDTNIIASAINYYKLESENSYGYARLGKSNNGFYCDDTGIITSFMSSQYDGDLQNIVIPELFDDIKPNALKNRLTGVMFPDDLHSITLPNSVETIGTRSFNNLLKLKKVIAPGVKNINDYAFLQCYELDTIIADNIQKIGNNSFNYCSSLSDFDIFKNASIIGDYAFRKCSFDNIESSEAISIGDYAFFDNENLYSVNMQKLKTAGQFAFCECKNLYFVDLPLLTSVGNSAFKDNPKLEIVNLPSLENLSKSLFENDISLLSVSLPSCYGDQTEAERAFANSGIKSISLNISEYIPMDAFSNCELEYGYFPNLEAFICEVPIKRAEFENLSVFLGFMGDSLPETMSVPSSCTEIIVDDEIEVNFNSITIYGTNETTIADWCEQNGVTFKNISQETALMTDLPEQITDSDTELEADVIGFNRTYQWYSNDVADNTSGTAIDGATSKYFTPSDYPLSDYYYCVVTSTDGDYDPVTIRTGVTANKSVVPSADYSAYNAALDTAQAVIDNPNYSDKYDANTRAEFESRLSELTLDILKAHSQSEIDSAANSILILINTLKVTDYVIEFKVFINNIECYSSTVSKSYADNINFNLSDINGNDYSSYSVERWTINSDTITSNTIIARNNKNLERVVTDDITISAYLVSKSTDDKEYSKVTLLSQSGAIIGVGYVEQGSIINTSTATVLTGDDIIGAANIIPFYNFGSWKLNGESVFSVSVDNDIILKAEYIYTSNTCKVISGSDSVLINSQYNPAGYNAAYDEKVYIKSSDGKQLAMYKENGDFISYIKNMGYISAPKASTIVIKEVDEVKPSTAITGAFILNHDDTRDKISFNCHFFLPDGCKLVECGAVLTGNQQVADSAQLFVIGAEKSLKAISQSQSENNEYTISIISDFSGKDAFYGRSYLIYLDENGNRQIIYGSSFKISISKGV